MNFSQSNQWAWLCHTAKRGQYMKLQNLYKIENKTTKVIVIVLSLLLFSSEIVLALENDLSACLMK
jgi:hypothetical protein